MIKTQMFIAAALLAGVAIGYFAGGRGAMETAAADSSQAAKKALADRGEAASVKALRRRVAELEKLLAEQGPLDGTVVATADAGGGRPMPGNPQEWLENLKKNDPARYAQMTNRWAQGRQRQAERAQAKLEFLSSVDVSQMGEKAQETHNALMDLVAAREEIMERLHQEGVTDSERRQLWEQVRSTSHELQRLNGQERSNLIREAAKKAGVKGKMAQELTATIREVIEATDGGWGGHRGGPRGQGPGGPHGR